MKPDIKLCVALLMMALVVHGAKKGKKNRKTSLQWNPSAMPAMNKRYVSVYEGKEFSLNCRAQGHPKPSVKWLQDGVEIRNNNNIEIKKFNLVLKPLTADMSGNYTCVVSNKHGQIDWTFHIDVQGESSEVKVWPLVIDGPKNITQTEGLSVSFNCHVLNDLHATIRWQKTRSNKNMDETAPQAEFLPDSDVPSVLTLDNIKKEDEGEYRCMAGNVWGLKYSSAWLTVLDPVSVSELPQPVVDKNNRVNNNNIVVMEPGSPGRFDNNVPMNVNEDDSLYDSEGTAPSDYNPDLFFTTTKRPKNSESIRKKNGRKKDRKDKGKNHMEEDLSSGSAITTIKTSSAITTEDIFKTTYPEIWQFESKEDYDEFGDTRSKSGKKNDMSDVENTDSSQSAENESFKGSISSWTIYTIVGAIGGVILLIGLLAITLTVCCKKGESGVYKSTSV